jgi:hypothetical protein
MITCYVYCEVPIGALRLPEINVILGRRLSYLRDQSPQMTISLENISLKIQSVELAGVRSQERG